MTPVEELPNRAVIAHDPKASLKSVPFAAALVTLAALLAAAGGQLGQAGAEPSSPLRPSQAGSAFSRFRPSIPEVWDEETLLSLEVPLANSKYSPAEVSWDFYYRMSRRPIYKSYPVYAPGREPTGYWNWLERQKPEIVWGIDNEGAFHAPQLKTKADWIEAGEMVFDAPIAYDSDRWGASVVTVDDVRNPAWYVATGTPVAADGTVPFARYVIRRPGIVELGQQACGMCHTRVLPGGQVVKGAQGNFPFDQAAAFRLQMLAAATANPGELLDEVRRFLRASFDVPWPQTRPEPAFQQRSLNDVIEALRAIPPGMTDRGGSSLFHPVQTPDLIGVEGRRYLDHTGEIQQRSIGDLMRYAAINQDVKGLARYGNFIPDGIDFRVLPDPGSRSRYRDEQLYALALYLYSLQPPPNPNPFDGVAARGRRVFEREGCSRCHTPPLYTNNQLTLAQGFQPSREAFKDFAILPVSVGTDSTLALDTRRGTGFYKVPSLQGLWYRGLFPHDGSCATLEDWFDPRRLHDSYVPTGYKGYKVSNRAVPGHPFGLNLSPGDKKALIAFLKTL